MNKIVNISDKLKYQEELKLTVDYLEEMKDTKAKNVDTLFDLEDKLTDVLVKITKD